MLPFFLECLVCFSAFQHAWVFSNVHPRLINALTETPPSVLQLKATLTCLRPICPARCDVPVSSFTASLLSNQEPVQRPPHAHGRQAERGGGEQVAGRSAGSAQHARTPQEPGRRRKLYP